MRLETSCSKNLGPSTPLHKSSQQAKESNDQEEIETIYTDYGNVVQTEASASVMATLPVAIQGPSLAAVITMPPARLELCIAQLRSSLTTFIEFGQTPFLKPESQANADCPVHEAFLACTAYRVQNPYNRVFVASTLSRKYIKLVRSLHGVSSTRDNLATLQAILVFQIMFLFGQDQRLREIAELTIQDVDRGMLGLQQQYFWTSTETHDYQTWLSLESIRRTILAHIYIKCVLSHATRGYTEFCPSLFQIPLTVHGGLWNASDQDQWLQIIQDQQLSPKSLIMPYAEAVNTWLADDYRNIDDMHVLLLSACRKSAASFRPASL